MFVWFDNGFSVNTVKFKYVFLYDKEPVMLFSERYGYRNIYRLGGFSFRRLKNES